MAATATPNRKCSTRGCTKPVLVYRRHRAGKDQVVTTTRCQECTVALRKASAAQRRKEGRTVREDGYVMIHVEGRGWVLEHVHVVEQALGRRLLPGETVHRKPGTDRADNRPENLEVWIGGRPAPDPQPHIVQARVIDTCPHCGGAL